MPSSRSSAREPIIRVSMILGTVLALVLLLLSRTGL